MANFQAILLFQILKVCNYNISKIVDALFNNLNNIFITKDVFLSDFLWIVFGRRSPNKCTFEIFLQRLMNLDAKVIDTILFGV